MAKFWEVSRTGDVVTQTYQSVLFQQPFATPPVFIAGMQTTNDPDTASVRCQSLGPTQVEVQIQEEQSLGSETDHAAEVVGYMVFGAP